MAAVALLALVWLPELGSSGFGRGLSSLALALVLLGRAAAQSLQPAGEGETRAERIAAVLAAAAAGATVLVTLLGVAGVLTWRAFATTIAVVTVAADWWRQRGSAGRIATGVSGRAPLPIALPVTLAVAWAGAACLSSARELRYTPPGGVHYDDVSYHLPAAATWFQHADLRMLRFEFGDPSTAFYPIGAETISWIFLAPLSSDFLARWSQLPAGIGLLLLAWALTRRAGGTPWASAVAALLPLTIPRFLPDGLFSAGNDLWVAFWLLATMLALFRLVEVRTVSAAAFLGVALGSFLGVKYFSLLGLPALLLAGGIALLASSREPAASGNLRLAGAAGSAAFLSGGFAYARNLLLAGNPVFPQPVSLAGWRLFDGWEAASLGQRVATVGEEALLGAFRARPELLGIVWGPLFVAAALGLPLLALWTAIEERTPESWRSLALAILPGALLLSYVLLAPDKRDVRYILAAPLLAGVAATAILSRAPGRWRAAVWLLAAAGILYDAATRAGGLDARRLISFAVAAGLIVAIGRARRRPDSRWVAAAFVVGLFALAPTGAKYVESHDRHEAAAIDLARFSGGAPTTVAYVGGNRPHFLFGPRLQRRVEIVPVTGDLESRFYGHRFGHPYDPFKEKKARVWLRNIDALGVEFVVVDADGMGSSRARWLERSDSPFEQVGESPGHQLWRRRAGAARGRPPR